MSWLKSQVSKRPQSDYSKGISEYIAYSAKVLNDEGRDAKGRENGGEVGGKATRDGGGNESASSVSASIDPAAAGVSSTGKGYRTKLYKYSTSKKSWVDHGVCVSKISSSSSSGGSVTLTCRNGVGKIMLNTYITKNSNVKKVIGGKVQAVTFTAMAEDWKGNVMLKVRDGVDELHRDLVG